MLEASKPMAEGRGIGEVGDRQTVDAPEAFRVLGISRTTGYTLIARGEFPVPIIRLGRRVVVSKRALEALLNQTEVEDQQAA